MPASFDPYHEWLGISPEERPISHYRLLGIKNLESQESVISNAADRQMTFIRTFQTGKYSQESQQILNELSQARVILLNPEKKQEYDAKLRKELEFVRPPKAVAVEAADVSLHSTKISLENKIPPKDGSVLSVSPAEKNLPPSVSASAINKKTVPVPPLETKSESDVLSSLFVAPDVSVEGNKHSVSPLFPSTKKTPLHPKAPTVQKKSQMFLGGGITAGVLLLLMLIWLLGGLGTSEKIVQRNPEIEKNTSSEKVSPSEKDRSAEKNTSAEKATDTDNKPASVIPETEEDVSVVKYDYATRADYVILTKYLGSDSEVKIPEMIENLPVKAINASTFRGCDTLTSVTIPDSVTYIESGVFGHCRNLEKIQFASDNHHYAVHDGVLFSKDGKALLACPQMKSGTYVIPDGVTTIEGRAFSRSHLEEIFIPEGVTTIMARAFYGCSALHTVTVPESVVVIEDKVFDGCPKLIIHGMNGSVAEKYAEKNGIKFEGTEAETTEDKAESETEKKAEAGAETEKEAEAGSAEKEAEAKPEDKAESGTEKESETGEAEKEAKTSAEKETKTEKAASGKTDNESAEEIKTSGEKKKTSARTKERKPGTRITKKINGVTYAFRWCPPGEFIMGSPKNELGRESDEKQHKVTFSEGFWIMETEVTQLMWATVMRNNPACFSRWGTSAYKVKGILTQNFPVEQVSWEDCQIFCEKLREKGFDIYLPTEAQWEYACRAGSTASLNNGKNITSREEACYHLNEVAWYTKNTDGKPCPVGMRKPNAWGIHDMHGNVWEWSADWHKSFTEEDVTDPTGPTEGTDRVARGGGWTSPTRRCRSACRLKEEPTNRRHYLGFRVIMLP
ncbi:MAG: SUMF1/EgtB/PvdO family nonheme iron enzyme [Planctomycetia bacterium]|nr:SUMF1/EgtB/PvdO family nonheme iron enzyme [Planctomycetia bacterium]